VSVVELYPPNANTGEPWGVWDTNDLLQCLRDQEPVWYIAQFLSRTPLEIRDRARELGVGHLLDQP
jgi:hypothetical protein